MEWNEPLNIAVWSLDSLKTFANVKENELWLLNVSNVIDEIYEQISFNLIRNKNFIL